MRFYNIFFSPTGGTEKVADIVAKGTKLDAEEIDLIKEPDKLMKVNFEKQLVKRCFAKLLRNGFV